MILLCIKGKSLAEIHDNMLKKINVWCKLEFTSSLIQYRMTHEACGAEELPIGPNCR